MFSGALNISRISPELFVSSRWLDMSIAFWINSAYMNALFSVAHVLSPSDEPIFSVLISVLVKKNGLKSTNVSIY